MATQVVPPTSEFVLNSPPPNEEQLAEIRFLKAQHTELMQKRRFYVGILHALHDELQQAFVTHRALHQQIDHLEVVLHSLVATQHLETLQGVSSHVATPGGNVENMDDFILHLLHCGTNLAVQSHEEPEVIDLEPPVLDGELALHNSALQTTGIELVDTKLQQSFVADRALHQEIYGSKTVLQSLGATKCPETSEGQSSHGATPGGSAENINDFTLQAFDAQTHEEPEVIDFEPSLLGGELALNFEAMETTRFGLIDKAASKAAFAVCAFGASADALAPSYVTSSVPGMSTEPACYKKCPENLGPRSQVCVQNPKLTATSANAPVTTPENIPNMEPTRPLTSNLIQQTPMQMRSSVPQARREHLEGRGVEVEDWLCADTGLCNVSLHQSGVEACEPPQPVNGLTQVLSHIPMSFSLGSALSIFTLHQASSSNTREEYSATREDRNAPTLQPTSCPIACGLTTLVIRNMPSKYTKEAILQEWPPDGTFDFLYLPFNHKQRRTSGYIFMNFTSHGAARDFYKKWHGKVLHNHATKRKLSIRAAEIQGLEENLRHLVGLNIHNITNPKHLPSVFNGVHEVLFTEVVEQMISVSTR